MKRNKRKYPAKFPVILLITAISTLIIGYLYQDPVYKAVEGVQEKAQVATSVTGIFSQSRCMPISDPNPAVYEENPWSMHSLDSFPAAGSDGVKLGDVNKDGLQDFVTGFEEGGVTRIYIHPGPNYAHEKWDYVELPSPDVEDAVFIDLDNDGILDVVTASEGATNKIIFHWAPGSMEDYLDASQWKSEAVPATDGITAWMFAVPMDLDGQNGQDIIVGSKRKSGLRGDDQAVVGWLQAPENPREMNEWNYHTITKAGWIMSIEPEDMDGDGDRDILISDRKNSTQTGVRWLENPGPDSRKLLTQWESHMIGVDQGEPMFLTMADLNDDGLQEILVPDLTNNLKIFEQTPDPMNRWITHTVDFPDWAGSRGKAVAVDDLDKDCHPDIILSFEEQGNVASLSFEDYQAQGKYSVIWGAYRDDPFAGKWDFYKVSSLKGRKYDLVNLMDLDDDGDLDVVTNDENEEGDGLGVIWYENPVIY